jgi:hypothetical protein
MSERLSVCFRYDRGQRVQYLGRVWRIAWQRVTNGTVSRYIEYGLLDETAPGAAVHIIAYEPDLLAAPEERDP